MPLPERLPAGHLGILATTTWLDSFVAWLDNPTVAFVLLALGIGSVMVEIAHPGIVGTGVLGVTAILLGLWSLSMQPVNGVGLALVVLAAALFLAELVIPTMGVAGLLGSVALMAGGLLLIEDEGGGGVPAGVVLPTSIVIGVAVVLAGRLALKARHRPSTLTGAERLLGRDVVLERVDETGTGGKVFTEGTWWQVRAPGPGLSVGSHARVTAVDGLVLVIEPRADNDDLRGKEAP